MDNLKEYTVFANWEKGGWRDGAVAEIGKIYATCPQKAVEGIFRDIPIYHYCQVSGFVEIGEFDHVFNARCTFVASSVMEGVIKSWRLEIQELVLITPDCG
jgi:hypothetical protein